MRLKRGVAIGASSLMLGSMIAGCTIIEGGSAENASKQAAPVQAAAAAPVAKPTYAAVNPAVENIASSGIPIPLPSPRHREFKVASISPTAGLERFSYSVPIRQLAGVYLKYGDAVAGAEKSKLNTPKEVRRVLKDLRFAQPETMAAGWYAVRAMTAAQNKAFADGVRSEVGRNGEARVLAALDNPDYVLSIPGASAAQADVIASVSAENQRLAALRKRFLDVAQQFQRQKWGMNEPLSPAQYAQAPAQSIAAPSMTTRLASLARSFAPIGEAQAATPTVMTRILALGARQILSAPVSSASARDDTSTCLNWARLNLNQCIAAAHFPSEEAWCTGTHGVEDVRACWASSMPAVH
ncbi:hypothetical protein [Parvibaculum sp.]|uniref:hypothetical protein n=1 Tax=Parvibaculum sp. TaxID=2024848 RepID=UPI00320D24BB